MNQARPIAAVVLLTLHLSSIRAELPSSCLTAITSSNSVDCCRMQPFLYVPYSVTSNFNGNLNECVQKDLHV